MAEKRRFARLTQDMPARHRVPSGSIEQASAKDISAGGIRLAASASLDIGTQLDVEVAITNISSPYYMRGEVVWLKENNHSGNKKFDMGIRFVRFLTQEEYQGF